MVGPLTADFASIGRTVNIRDGTGAVLVRHCVFHQCNLALKDHVKMHAGYGEVVDAILSLSGYMTGQGRTARAAAFLRGKLAAAVSVKEQNGALNNLRTLVEAGDMPQHMAWAHLVAGSVEGLPDKFPGAIMDRSKSFRECAEGLYRREEASNEPQENVIDGAVAKIVADEKQRQKFNPSLARETDCPRLAPGRYEPRSSHQDGRESGRRACCTRPRYDQRRDTLLAADKDLPR
jgi:hypothetical protein